MLQLTGVIITSCIRRGSTLPTPLVQSAGTSKRTRRTFNDPTPLGRFTYWQHELFATTVDEQETESLASVLVYLAEIKPFSSYMVAVDFYAKMMKSNKQVEADLERNRRRFRILPAITRKARLIVKLVQSSAAFMYEVIN